MMRDERTVEREEMSDLSRTSGIWGNVGVVEGEREAAKGEERS